MDEEEKRKEKKWEVRNPKLGAEIPTIHQMFEMRAKSQLGACMTNLDYSWLEEES